MSDNELDIDMGATTVEDYDEEVESAIMRYWYGPGSLTADRRQEVEGYFRYVLEGTLRRAYCPNMSEAAWAVFFHRLRTDPLEVNLEVRYWISARMDREYEDCDSILTFDDDEGLLIDQLYMDAQGSNDPWETSDVIWAGRILALACPSRSEYHDL